LLDLARKVFGQVLVEVIENHHCSLNISEANKTAFNLTNRYEVYTVYT